MHQSMKLSQREEKLIRSLRQKKYRKKEQLFIVEGTKLLSEVQKSAYELVQVFASSEWLATEGIDFKNVREVEETDLKKVSNLSQPPGVLALVAMKHEVKVAESDFTLALEHIQDPGNLGTILRSAAAFGVKTVLCSTDTVDCYSPKVVQASMGALFHLNVVYTDLESYLSQEKERKRIYGTHLEGENLYKTTLQQPAILVMGNEANGLSPKLEKLLHQKLCIPHDASVESLNVSMATTVFLAEYRRRVDWG